MLEYRKQSMLYLPTSPHSHCALRGKDYWLKAVTLAQSAKKAFVAAVFAFNTCKTVVCSSTSAFPELPNPQR